MHSYTKIALNIVQITEMLKNRAYAMNHFSTISEYF